MSTRRRMAIIFQSAKTKPWLQMPLAWGVATRPPALTSTTERWCCIKTKKNNTKIIKPNAAIRKKLNMHYLNIENISLMFVLNDF